MLQQYNIEIIYIPGPRNVIADSLSRIRYERSTANRGDTTVDEKLEENRLPNIQ